MDTARRPDMAVIFDLDGVLTDTAELHFQSWMDMARQLEIPFDRQTNEQLRGLSRADSLVIFLGEQAERFGHDERVEIAREKNERYLARVKQMTHEDAMPGARELINELHARKLPLAVASSSRNARVVLEQLKLTELLDVVVDGNDVARSKPDPELFLTAAERLGMRPEMCVVVEDAQSGVQAALAANMKVVGVGPQERVGQAHRVVDAVSEIKADGLVELLRPG